MSRIAQVKAVDWLLLLMALSTIGIVGHALWTLFRPETRVELGLLPLNNEIVSIPEPFVGKGLPLEELHSQIQGANLDYPRAFVSLYSDGQSLGQGWGAADGLKGAIAAAYHQAEVPGTGRPTSAMLVIPTNGMRIRGHNYKRYLSNVHRGVRGVIIRSGDAGSSRTTRGEVEFLLSPTHTIATNRTIQDDLEDAARSRGVTVDSWLESSVAHAFDARQFYIPLATQENAQETLRGNRLIEVAEVSKESTLELVEGLGDWMFENLHADGRLTYTYYPSSGREEQNANSMVRQWLATVALGRVALQRPDRSYSSRAERNLRYNLRHSFRVEGDLGFIEFHDTASLGAASTALISLIESPARASFASEEEGLLRFTLHLWRDSGEMRTFYKPTERNDNQNFFPGETLLVWSLIYGEREDPELLDKAMASYRYYRSWHLNNRHPAFIPWHTQALYTFWKKTKSKEVQEWILTMNDWLVDTMQSSSRAAYDDTIGRFHSPTERFGYPHAASTGVYLEGLIDAFALARKIGDTSREEKYRRAIILGLRSAMQLQFVDDVDMYYVADRRRLRGGLRTTVFDNTVRVDNVQHVLLAAQKILREFESNDFDLTERAR